MTDRPRTRRPGPALVIWSSIALFAMTFAFLTYQLSSSTTTPRPVLVKKVLKRRVVTTIVPTPGRSVVTSSGAAVGSLSSGYAPVTTSAS